MYQRISFFFFYIILSVIFVCPRLKAQGTQEIFGQNRVQYKDFEWSFFETEKFVTYFYLGGQDIGKYVIQYAEKEVERVETILEYKINKRIEILVYNDLSDLNQTNIGQNIELHNPGGLTKIIENKMFVYFNGNHDHLEHQIRRGIAQIFINHIVFGGNLQEILQNAVLLNLPHWYTDGLASYVGEDWSVELDNKLRDGILTGKYKKFNKLTREESKFVGHALWHYVEEKYGKSAVPNLLYLTRINRSVENGFLFVLGGSVKAVIEEWHEYYYNHYVQERDQSNLPTDSACVPLRRFKRQVHYQPRISSDSTFVAFVTNNLGKYRVMLHDYKNGGSKLVMKGGVKTLSLMRDHQYPLLSWSPDGKTLGIIYEKRDKLYLMLYNWEKRQKVKQLITKFQQIHNFDFTDDPRLLVMSASNRGVSDIYTYYIPSTLVEQITNDHYDDLEAGFIDIAGKKGIMFLSNRQRTELKPEKLDTVLLEEKYDLYYYDLGRRSSELIKVTSTPYFNEAQPVKLNDSLFSFIADNNGIKNRYAGYFESILTGYDTTFYFIDSVVTNPTWNFEMLSRDAVANLDSVRVRETYDEVAYTFPITDYFTNIIEHDISASGKVVDMHLLKRRHEFFVHELSDSSIFSAQLENTFYRNFAQTQVNRQMSLEKERQKVKDDINEKAEFSDTAEVEEAEMFFQSDFNTAPEIDVPPAVDLLEISEDSPVFMLTKVRPYRVKFSTDYVLTQLLDNTIIMTRYEKFTPGFPVYNNPPLSFMINMGVSDLFENYRITGGFRFPYDLKGSEYFISYENLKKRLDKRISYYRKVEQETFFDTVPFYGFPIPTQTGQIESKVKTNYLELRLTYPFDVVRSLRWYAAFRHDNYVFLSKEDFSHNLPNYSESWLFAKTEYVHDNTVPVGLNLLNGIRFKFFAEFHKQILFEPDTILNDVRIKLPDFNEAYFTVFGFDFRYYQKVHKNIVWANRFAWSTSLGTRKLIYYLGGVDGWISPLFDQSASINENNNYAFQTLATNLRGFDQNVRNGNSFVVYNTELRVPIFAYLSNSTIKSEFIKNFQVVGFADLGTAWEGPNPWSKENPLFTDILPDPLPNPTPIVVEVEYFKNPIVFGYGFGLRTSLFGYFIRFDVAWGNDSGIKSEKPKLYFSLTFDF